MKMTLCKIAVVMTAVSTFGCATNFNTRSDPVLDINSAGRVIYHNFATKFELVRNETPNPMSYSDGLREGVNRTESSPSPVEQQDVTAVSDSTIFVPFQEHSVHIDNPRGVVNLVNKLILTPKILVVGYSNESKHVDDAITLAARRTTIISKLLKHAGYEQDAIIKLSRWSNDQGVGNPGVMLYAVNNNLAFNLDPILSIAENAQ